jgi:hypothetical protein
MKASSAVVGDLGMGIVAVRNRNSWKNRPLRKFL